jgi:hypothetical protein
MQILMKEVVLVKIYKNITVDLLFRSHKKTIHLFVDRRLRSCTCFFIVILQVWRNSQVFLNRQVTHLPSCHVSLKKFVLKCEQCFSFFILRSGLNVTGLARVYYSSIIACGSVWVWNLVSDIKGGTLTEGVWGEYLDRREMKWQEVGENYIMRSFITCTLRQVQLEWSSHGGWDGQGV